MPQEMQRSQRKLSGSATQELIRGVAGIEKGAGDDAQTQIQATVESYSFMGLLRHQEEIVVENARDLRGKNVVSAQAMTMDADGVAGEVSLSDQGGQKTIATAQRVHSIFERVAMAVVGIELYFRKRFNQKAKDGPVKDGLAAEEEYQLEGGTVIPGDVPVIQASVGLGSVYAQAANNNDEPHDAPLEPQALSSASSVNEAPDERFVLAAA